MTIKNLNESMKIFRKVKSFNILNENIEIKIGMDFFDSEKLKVIKNEINEINKIIDKRVVRGECSKSRTIGEYIIKERYNHCDGSYQIETYRQIMDQDKKDLIKLELFDQNNVKIILPFRNSKFLELLNFFGFSFEKIAEFIRPYQCTFIGDIVALYHGGLKELRYKKRKDASIKSIKGGLMRTGLYTAGGALAGSLLGHGGIGAAAGGLIGAGQSIYNYFGNKDTLKFSDMHNNEGS